MKQKKADSLFSHAKLQTGKLPATLLERMLQKVTARDDRVRIGPGVGLDAAAVDFGSACLIAKTDPITFTDEKIAWYALHVNANDIACMGAMPRWFLATLLLPETRATEEMVAQIFAEMQTSCREVGVSLIGGHTEITPGLTRPVLVGCMLGECAPDRLLDVRKCEAGDRIIAASAIAIEATSIIAQMFEQELLETYDTDFVAKCKNFYRKPGISILRIARKAQDTGRIRAMHDPTEGGIATALHEIADACEKGVEVHEEHIPIRPETKLLCDQYDLNALGAISSGALLIIVPPEAEQEVLHALHSAGIPAASIGQILPDPESRWLHWEEGKVPLPRFDRDEIVKLL